MSITDFSDGVEGIEGIVSSARQMGFSYVGITDHSRSAYYAGGLKEEDVRRQWELIDRLRVNNPDVYIFKGIESDILPDGSLDYDDDLLEGFDFVIASVHSGFTMKQADMEARIMRAMENPHTTMLGHPHPAVCSSRGMVMGVDMRRLIDCAAQKQCNHGTECEPLQTGHRLAVPSGMRKTGV